MTTTFFRVGVALVLGAGVSGCISVPKLVAPVGVEPLPYGWSVNHDEAVQLCKAKAKRWPLRWFIRAEIAECRTTGEMDQAARNSLQHQLLGEATQACQRFKNKLYSMTKGGVIFGAAAQISSAASGLIRVDRSAKIASSTST